MHALVKHIHMAPHVQQRADRKQRRDEIGAPIAHERQGQSFGGQAPCDHADVERRLKHQQERHAERQHPAEPVRRT